jgi:hypothetical protein
MNEERFRFKDVPVSVEGSLAPRCAFTDDEPLTDAWWAQDGALCCVRRRRGSGDLVEMSGSQARLLLRDKPIAGLGGLVEHGVVVNVQTQLLYYEEGGFRSLWQTAAEIALFDVNRSLGVVGVVGKPPEWKPVVVSSSQGREETPNLKRVVGAVWLDHERVVFEVLENKAGRESLVFVMRDGRGLYVRLFETALVLRADLVSNGQGALFVSGGTLDAAGRGAWLLDPTKDSPYDTFSSILPLGHVCFVNSGTVVYPAQLVGRNVIVVADRGGTRAFGLPGRLPARVASSPDGTEIAWAEPSRQGGKLWIATLPRG